MASLFAVQAGCLVLGIPMFYHVMLFERVQRRIGVKERNPPLTCASSVGAIFFILSAIFCLRIQPSALLIRLQFACLNMFVWSPVAFRASQHLARKRGGDLSRVLRLSSNESIFRLWCVFLLEQVLVELVIYFYAPASAAAINAFGTNFALLLSSIFIFLCLPKNPDPLHLRKDLRICLCNWALMPCLVLPLSLFGLKEQSLYVAAAMATHVFSIQVINPVYLSGFDKRGRRIHKKPSRMTYLQTLGNKVTGKSLGDFGLQMQILGEIFKDPNATAKLHALAQRDFQPENSKFLEATHLFHLTASKVAEAFRGQAMSPHGLQSLEKVSTLGYSQLGPLEETGDQGLGEPEVQQPVPNGPLLKSPTSKQLHPHMELEDMLGKAYDNLLREFVLPGSPQEVNISTALRDSLLSFRYLINDSELKLATSDSHSLGLPESVTPRTTRPLTFSPKNLPPLATKAVTTGPANKKTFFQISAISARVAKFTPRFVQPSLQSSSRVIPGSVRAERGSVAPSASLNYQVGNERGASKGTKGTVTTGNVFHSAGSRTSSFGGGIKAPGGGPVPQDDVAREHPKASPAASPAAEGPLGRSPIKLKLGMVAAEGSREACEGNEEVGDPGEGARGRERTGSSFFEAARSRLSSLLGGAPLCSPAYGWGPSRLAFSSGRRSSNVFSDEVKEELSEY